MIIHMVTYETMAMDLFINGEDDPESLVEKIIDEENLLKFGDTYILGDVSAAYLKLKYGITCAAQKIE